MAPLSARRVLWHPEGPRKLEGSESFGQLVTVFVLYRLGGPTATLGMKALQQYICILHYLAVRGRGMSSTLELGLCASQYDCDSE
jgi:hypothetical protein